MIPAIAGTAAVGALTGLVGKATGAENNKKPEGFFDMMTRAMEKADKDQAAADTEVKRLITGEQKDLHHVMLSMEQARLSMMTVIEVRNKLVESYQELSRMPV